MGSCSLFIFNHHSNAFHRVFPYETKSWYPWFLLWMKLETKRPQQRAGKLLAHYGLWDLQYNLQCNILAWGNALLENSHWTTCNSRTIFSIGCFAEFMLATTVLSNWGTVFSLMRSDGLSKELHLSLNIKNMVLWGSFFSKGFIEELFCNLHLNCLWIRGWLVYSLLSLFLCVFEKCPTLPNGKAISCLIQANHTVAKI